MDKSALLGPGGDEGHSMLSASMPISAPAAVVVTAVPTAPASAAGPLTGQLSTLGQLIAAKNAARALVRYRLNKLRGTPSALDSIIRYIKK